MIYFYQMLKGETSIDESADIIVNYLHDKIIYEDYINAE